MGSDADGTSCDEYEVECAQDMFCLGVTVTVDGGTALNEQRRKQRRVAASMPAVNCCPTGMLARGPACLYARLPALRRNTSVQIEWLCRLFREERVRAEENRAEKNRAEKNRLRRIGPRKLSSQSLLCTGTEPKSNEMREDDSH